MTISDKRLAELAEGWAHQARVHISAAGAMAGDAEYSTTCEDTAVALRELQQFRLQAAMCRNCGGTRGPDHACPALEGL